MTSNPSVDVMFKAFADETRLRILHLLAQKELCVCDLVDTLRLPQPKISRHLAYLRDAGLVVDRKQGLWKYYSLTPAHGQFHKGLLQCLTGCFEEVAILKKDVAALKKNKKTRSCL